MGALSYQEGWYQFLVEQDVKFTRIECNNDEDDQEGNARFVANIRICGRKVPLDKALPSGVRGVSRHRRPISASAAANRQRGISNGGGFRNAKKVIKFKTSHVQLNEYEQVLKYLIEAGPECAKPRLFSWLMKNMEEMYDARYV